MHSLIIGSTESGKTTIAKKLGVKHASANYPVIVLTTVYESWGQGVTVYDDQEEFLAVYWNLKRKAMAMIDEGKDNIGRFNEAMEVTATRGRHWGMSNYYIAQRLQMISPDIRGQCSQLFCFSIGQKDAATLAEEFVQPQLVDAPNLKRGEFYLVRRFGQDGGKFCKKLNAFSF